MQAIIARYSIWRSTLWSKLNILIPAEKHVSRPVSSKAENSHGSTVNQEEVEKFNALSTEWWLAKGDFSALRAMNALRVPYIRDGILSSKAASEQKTPLPLKGYSILDVGCGGGLLSEPLARLGASVVGLDPSPDNIKIATEHAAGEESLKENLTYICSDVEKLCQNKDESFDAVVCSEVIEHVDNPELFVHSCVDLVKSGGSLFFTTINRTTLSYGLAIIAAEYVLNIVPRGTHSWGKFVKPEELECILKNKGCDVRSVQGMVYNPLTYKWSWAPVSAVNYAMHVVKTF